MVAVAASTEGSAAEASMVVEAVSTEGLAAAASVAGAAFAVVTEAFGEATAAMAEAGVVSAGAGAAMAEAGVMADSVTPTSVWALVSIPGPTGLDRISATTDTRIILTTDATILMGLIRATRMVTIPILTIPLPTGRT